MFRLSCFLLPSQTFSSLTGRLMRKWTLGVEAVKVDIRNEEIQQRYKSRRHISCNFSRFVCSHIQCEWLSRSFISHKSDNIYIASSKLNLKSNMICEMLFAQDSLHEFLWLCCLSGNHWKFRTMDNLRHWNVLFSEYQGKWCKKQYLYTNAVWMEAEWIWIWTLKYESCFRTSRRYKSFQI
jgi:hypothetical protein